MDNNQLESALLNDAARCPVCEAHPSANQEDVLGHYSLTLRCPNGHPYVASGSTITMAIANWDEYIAFQIMDDTSRMFGDVARNVNMSYCRHCRRFTKSDTRFSKVEPNSSHLGYSITQHQCLECHLIKSQKEAA